MYNFYKERYTVLMKAYMVGVARHSFAIGIDKWECVYVDNLQVNYKALTKACSVGVASHFLAIVINKWECVYVKFTKESIGS